MAHGPCRPTPHLAMGAEEQKDERCVRVISPISIAHNTDQTLGVCLFVVCVPWVLCVWVGEEENQLQKNLAHEARWRGNNAEGFLVNDGIYMYTITTATGGILEKGTIALVR